MPLIATRGAASAQGFGEFAQTTAPVYIEDVFSTWLYTGNGSTQTITNGIDLSTKGGLVWVKTRNVSDSNYVTDTARGTGYYLATNTTGSQGGGGGSTTVSAFNTNGFSLGSAGGFNGSGETLVSWTFREQPKFFDVVTYTGNGTTQSISHTLGSTPGCVIVKSTSAAGTAWYVWHRSFTAGYYAFLNTTAAQTNANSAISFGNNTTYVDPTSTNFTVGSNGDMNDSGQSYVAYLFAHNAGGFGLTGSDNVISCGSYTGNGSATGPVINLGYEPQWLMIKRATGTANGNWVMLDVMRGFSTSTDNELYANLSLAEGSGLDLAEPQATGFQIKSSSSGVNASGSDYIYIAIRRGPMKTPTSGTSVYFPNTRTGTGATATVTGVGFPPDLVWTDTRSAAEGAYMFDKLRGPLLGLRNFGTDAEVSDPQYLQIFGQNGFTYGTNGSVNQNTRTYIDWCMRRAPGFFDVVCYTGDGTLNRQVNHNLTVTPELIIAKRRSGAQSWIVFGSVISTNNYLILDSTGALNSLGATTVYASTSTTFGAQAFLSYNDSAVTYVAYLFASCPGVSKVGSYTGTGALQTVNCGFTGGARFVLIKRTDSTGDWWVYDSARGISSGNDPYLFLNSTAAEVTGTNYVDTTSVGFQVTAAAPAGLNANGGTYIFLAIA